MHTAPKNITNKNVLSPNSLVLSKTKAKTMVEIAMKKYILFFPIFFEASLNPTSNNINIPN